MLKELEAKLDYHFQNSQLLATALVHRSFVNENRSVTEHNERLEFLGDAVLELVTTEYLFAKYPDKSEGDLTAWRSALVKGERLAEVAAELELGKYLQLSKGESRSGGREKAYLLANTFEAVLGALYLDGGFVVVQDFLGRVLLPRIESILADGLHVDAKSKLQELAQEKESVTPEYKVLAEAGPDHAKEFTIGAFFGDKQVGEGVGSSKQAGEQAAARDGLTRLGW